MQVDKKAASLPVLLGQLAGLLESYGYQCIPGGKIPASASTLAPLDMPTLYPAKAMQVAKVVEDQQLVFGWASISTDPTGALIVDSDGESIEPAELEKAAYDYVLEARAAGELHKGDAVGQIVESLVLSPEKASAMGFTMPPMTGWWIGVHVEDPEVFAKVKDGTYSMFSIEGRAELVNT